MQPSIVSLHPHGRSRLAAPAAAAVLALLLSSSAAAHEASGQSVSGAEDLRAAASASRFRPGSAGLGDPYFPRLGNGGYQVTHYGLDLRYLPAKHHLGGTARIMARAKHPLSRFHLDFSGFRVGSVEVNGDPATFRRRHAELIVIPSHGLLDGRRFLVTVTYAGTPHTVKNSPIVFGSDYGWMFTRDGAFVACEPAAAHTWFPSNDYPTDKARFSFRITVPHGKKVVANGTLVDRLREGPMTTYVWRERQPMATYLATIDIGRWNFHRRTTPAGTPSFIAVDPRLAKEARRQRVIRTTARVTDDWERTIGRYPFGSTGAIVDNVPNVGFSLETQTRPVYGFAPDEFTVSHELAHMWFGDSVSVKRWRHIWLNEGFATYFGFFVWLQHNGGPTTWELTSGIWNDIDAQDPFWDLSIGNPGRRHMFEFPVYLRGALTLGALKHEIGARDMRELLRTWARAHRFGNASTSEFVALANRISGQDLTRFFRLWLRREAKPPLPDAEPAAPVPAKIRTWLNKNGV